MKTNIQTRRGFTLVELLVVIVIIASLAGLTAPMVIRQRKKADQTEATSNARQIGIAMLEFDTEYGSFPGTTSLVAVALNNPTAVVTGAAGADSNGYFKQFFQADLTQSEAMFYAKAKGTRKPDGDISTNLKALEKGEVGFGYITDGAEGMSSAGNPARAVAVTPLAVGSTTDFDGNPFDKKAVILRIDNSATSVPISVAAGNTTNTGKALVGGVDLLLTTNPVWGTTVPTVRPPL